MRTFLTSAVLALSVSGTAVVAEEGFYYGLGLGYTHGTSELGTHSLVLDEVTLGGTIGYRWDAANMFYAAEADLDLGLGQEFVNQGTSRPCSEGASNPYICAHNATLRLRGMVGMDAGNYEIFGTLGFIGVSATRATSPTTTTDITNNGFTAGIGLQREMQQGMGRLELIYDQADESDDIIGNQYQAVSLKATWIF